MADQNQAANRWTFGTAYFGLMCLLMLVHILPIHIGPNGVPGPNLLICVTFVWVLRRPQYIPTPLIALVFFLADVLFMRPPGLWTALVVIAVEILRARETTSREQPFPIEWVIVAVVFLGITVANRLILALFVVHQAGLGLTLLQYIATIMTYPLVVLLSLLLFGVQKMSPGEMDARGRRV